MPCLAFEQILAEEKAVLEVNFRFLNKGKITVEEFLKKKEEYHSTQKGV